MAAGPEGSIERPEVELLNRLDHKPRQVVPGSQSRRSGGSSSGWSRSQARKFCGASFPLQTDGNPGIYALASTKGRHLP